ncbi:MAG: hypothetical protein JSR76_03940 [Verrucomicrobia bacterium]|nr:hypothetical protein [Verrucomicrobiota bacterium]
MQALPVLSAAPLALTSFPTAPAMKNYSFLERIGRLILLIFGALFALCLNKKDWIYRNWTIVTKGETLSLEQHSPVVSSNVAAMPVEVALLPPAAPVAAPLESSSPPSVAPKRCFIRSREVGLSKKFSDKFFKSEADLITYVRDHPTDRSQPVEIRNRGRRFLYYFYQSKNSYVYISDVERNTTVSLRLKRDGVVENYGILLGGSKKPNRIDLDPPPEWAECLRFLLETPPAAEGVALPAVPLDDTGVAVIGAVAPIASVATGGPPADVDVGVPDIAAAPPALDTAPVTAAVPPPPPPTHVSFGAALIEAFMGDVKAVAPSKTAAKTLQRGGDTYEVWYDKRKEAVCFQTKADAAPLFSITLDAQRDPVYYQDGVQCEGLLYHYQDDFAFINDQISYACRLVTEMDRLEGLDTLLNYVRGTASPLVLQDDLLQTPFRLSSTTEGALQVLHIEASDGKLSVAFDIAESRLSSVSLTGVDTFSALYETIKPGSIWGDLLQRLVTKFLREKAARAEGGTFYISPDACKIIPEEVLEKFVAADSRSVRFLDARMQVDPGIDNGGPSRQFITMLGMYLGDGGAKRGLQVSEGVLILPEGKRRESEKTYENFGKFLAKVSQWNVDRGLGAVVGRILADSFFEALVAFHRASDRSEANLIKVVAKALDAEPYRPIVTFLESGRAEAAARRVLEDAGYDPVDLTTTQALRREALALLTEQYRGVVTAVTAVHKGLQTGRNLILASDTGRSLSERLQGEAVSPDLIIRKLHKVGILDHSPESLVVGFLEAIIRDKGRRNGGIAWLERFVYCVTGKRAMTAETKIYLQPMRTGGSIPIAHTCSSTMEIPVERARNERHTRETFERALEELLALANSGYTRA